MSSHNIYLHGEIRTYSSGYPLPFLSRTMIMYFYVRPARNWVVLKGTVILDSAHLIRKQFHLKCHSKF